MASFEGNWECDYCENLEECMIALGIPEDKREIVLKHRQLICFGPFVQNSWSYRVDAGALVRETTLKIAEEFDTVSITGQPAKSKLTLDGNVITEIQRYGENETVLRREVTKDRLTLKMNCKGITAVMKFKRI